MKKLPTAKATEVAAGREEGVRPYGEPEPHLYGEDEDQHGDRWPRAEPKDHAGQHAHAIAGAIGGRIKTMHDLLKATGSVPNAVALLKAINS